MNDRGIKAPFLLSLSSRITNPEHTSQIKLVKDPGSNRVNDILINKTIPVTLYNTEKKIEIQEDLLKTITNEN